MDERETKPFRVVGTTETLKSLMQLNGRVNATPWRGWPVDSVTLLVTGTRMGERLPRWVFTVKPVEKSPFIRVINPQTGEVTTHRYLESIDFSFVDHLENAIDFATAPGPER